MPPDDENIRSGDTDHPGLIPIHDLRGPGCWVLLVTPPD